MKCDSQPDLRFDELFIPVCVLHSYTADYLSVLYVCNLFEL